MGAGQDGGTRGSPGRERRCKHRTSARNSDTHAVLQPPLPPCPLAPAPSTSAAGRDWSGCLSRRGAALGSELHDIDAAQWDVGRLQRTQAQADGAAGAGVEATRASVADALTDGLGDMEPRAGGTLINPYALSRDPADRGRCAGQCLSDCSDSCTASGPDTGASTARPRQACFLHPPLGTARAPPASHARR